MKRKTIIKQGNKITKKILKAYKSYKISFKIRIITFTNGRYVIETKIEPGGKTENIKKHEKNVRMLLRLPVFQVHEEGLSVNIVAATHETMNNSLMQILKQPQFGLTTRGMEIPYAVGFDLKGNSVVSDVKVLTNLLIGGEPRSGKSVSLASLIISAAWSCPPDKLEIFIVDNRATGLNVFKELPHVSTVINDAKTALNAILTLKKEADESVNLSPEAFNALPRKLLIIDELPALVSAVGKNQNLLINALQEFLQSAHHAKIHTIIAAQNPIKDILRIDTASAVTRMAFRCPRSVHSRTILDENGAENLTGNGDMLFSSPTYDGLKRLKGSYISTEEIPAVIEQICIKYGNESPRQFVIKELDELMESETIFDEPFISEASKVKKSNTDVKLLAKVLMWSLTCTTISGNLIYNVFKEKYNVGEKKAAKFLDFLYRLGIVGEKDAKNPRIVIPNSLKELPTDTITFLERNGYSREDVENALALKKNNEA